MLRIPSAPFPGSHDRKAARAQMHPPRTVEGDGGQPRLGRRHRSHGSHADTFARNIGVLQGFPGIRRQRPVRRPAAGKAEQHSQVRRAHHADRCMRQTAGELHASVASPGPYDDVGEIRGAIRGSPALVGMARNSKPAGQRVYRNRW